MFTKKTIQNTLNREKQKNNFLFFQCELGQMALFSVIIISFFTLLWATTMNIISIDKMELSFTKHKSDETFYISDACVNHALGNLKYNSNYTGENLNIDTESCTITVVGGSNEKTITSTTVIDNKTRQIEAVVQIVEGSPNSLTIISWQEI